MSEYNLWRWLRQTNTLGQDLHMMRIENAIERGTPDVYGCYMGWHFWLELKVADRPVRSKTPVRIQYRAGQEDWHIRHRAACGNSYVLLQVERSRFLIPSAFAFDAPVPLDALAERSLVSIHAKADTIIREVCSSA